jgi:tetratricopeptide (TPR) repeat protein
MSRITEFIRRKEFTVKWRRAKLRLHSSKRRILKLSRTDELVRQRLHDRVRKPDDWRVHHLLGESLVAHCEYVGARGEFTEALRLNPDNWVVSAELAGTLMKLGRWDEFREWHASRSPAVRDAMRRFATDVRISRICGYHALQTGRYPEAYATLTNVLRSVTGDALAHLGRAAAIRGLGSEWESLVDDWLGLRQTPAFLRSQSRVEECRERVRTILAHGGTRGPDQHLSDGLENWPDTSADDFVAGATKVMTGGCSAAGQLLAALALLVNGRMAEAAERVRQTPLDELTTGMSQLFAARIAAECGELRVARRALERAVASQPASEYAWFRLFEFQWESELTLVELSHFPGDDAVCNRIAAHLESAGRRAESTDFHQAWLQHRPSKNAAILRRLADSLLQQGRLDDARTFAQQSLAADPADTATLLLLAGIAARVRDRKVELQYLHDAKLIADQPADVHVRICRLHHDSGDLASAARVALDAIKAHPDHRAIRAQGERLDALVRVRRLASESAGLPPDSPAADRCVADCLETVDARLKAMAAPLALSKAEMEADRCEYLLYVERISKSHKRPEIYRLLGRLLNSQGKTYHAQLAEERAARIEQSQRAGTQTRRGNVVQSK